RRMKREGVWPQLLGTVFAHRVFDLVAVIVLILYVALTAHIPNWAVTSLIAVVGAGVVLFTVAVMSARSHHVTRLEEGVGALRKTIQLARYGLGVMRRPAAAAAACLFQIVGWACQLFAVYTTMRAFGIHEQLPAAGLVLVLMNVATLFPLWPGNIGLVQAAVALPLFQYYGVAKANGIAFGFGLQAIEASVGVGVGLLFLAREGLSFAMLKVMPDAAQAEVPDDDAEPPAEPKRAPSHARMSG
ncbi:MAG: YbhN family protein, partial [Gaiellaceae bacterium]